MGTKIIYITISVICFICYFIIPAMLLAKIAQDKEYFPKLHRKLYVEYNIESVGSFIGWVNTILLGLLVSLTPVLHLIIIIVTLLLGNEDFMLTFLEYFEDDVDDAVKKD